MAHHVYANNHEIAGKAASGKSVIPTGDVCWTPPTSPPSPMGVPIPYPNTCLANTITNGTRTVMIKNKTVSMEDKSYFSTSTGDEPATEALQKGIISHKIKGRCYFKRWSPNVKFEGSGVARNLDMVTHNHSNPPNIPLVPYVSIATMPAGRKKEAKAIEDSCKSPSGDPTKNWMDEHCKGLKQKPTGSEASAKAMTKRADTKNACVKARKCHLVPYSKQNAADGSGCCPGQTGHHVMPDSMFRDPIKLQNLGLAKAPPRSKQPLVDDFQDYTEKDGLTVCAEGTSNGPNCGSHGKLHAASKERMKNIGRDGFISYEEARDKMIEAVRDCYPNCSKKRLKAQLDQYYGKAAKNPQGMKVKLKEAEVQPHDGMQGGGMDVPNIHVGR